MKYNINVRSANIKDASILSSLYRQLFPERQIDDQQIVDYLIESEGDNNLKILVVEINSQVIGTCQTIIYNNPIRQPQKKGIIDSVVIDKCWRRKGYGAYLIKFAIQELFKSNCEMIGLIAGYQRLESYGFYDKIGFINYGRGFYIINDS